MYADNSLFDEGVIGVVEVFKDGGYVYWGWCIKCVVGVARYLLYAGNL